LCIKQGKDEWATEKRKKKEREKGGVLPLSKLFPEEEPPRNGWKGGGYVCQGEKKKKGIISTSDREKKKKKKHTVGGGRSNKEKREQISVQPSARGAGNTTLWGKGDLDVGFEVQGDQVRDTKKGGEKLGPSVVHKDGAGKEKRGGSTSTFRE